jgi:hypothetical protein
MLTLPQHRLVAPLLVSFCTLTVVAWSPPSPDLVAVRHSQGMLHGFLALRTLADVPIADGDSIQTTVGDRVTTRTVFHFKDGSLSDETTVFSQSAFYRLVSYHLVQKGPTFDRPLTMEMDASRGRVVVHYKGNHGEDKVDDEQMNVPADVCNGLLITLLEDVDPSRLPLTVSFVANTPQARLVKLVISAAGSAPFSVGDVRYTATDYVVKTDIGGLTGVLAAIFGKQPLDAHVWVLRGEAPAFVRSEAPMYPGGPLLRTELTNPQWPKR